MKNCPKCSAAVDGLQCPQCGYTDPGYHQQLAVDPNRVIIEQHGHTYSVVRCAFEDRGERCARPGTLSTAVAGGEAATWWCDQHFPPFRSRGAFIRATEEAREQYHHVRSTLGTKTLRKHAKPLDTEAIAERFAIQHEGEHPHGE